MNKVDFPYDGSHHVLILSNVNVMQLAEHWERYRDESFRRTLMKPTQNSAHEEFFQMDTQMTLTLDTKC